MENETIERNTSPYLQIAVQLSPLLNALGHRARVQILLHLAQYHGCSAGTISDRLPLAKSTVSVHLAKLKEAGFVNSQDDGTSVRYQMSEDGYQMLKNLVSDLFETIEEWRSHQTECYDTKAGNGCL